MTWWTVGLLILGCVGACSSRGGAQFVEDDLTTRFVSPDGRSIEIASNNSTIQIVGSEKVLHDCGNSDIYCYFDDSGFKFSFFRECVSAGQALNYNRLRFQPIVVSVLHDRLWLVFNESPAFLFEYAWGKGVVGIYYSTTQDLRQVPTNPNAKITDLDGILFKKVGAGIFAACVE